MNALAHSEREVEGAHSLFSQAALLLDESRALTYALVMALAHTPHKEVSQEEVDGLCQLAYELLNKLTRANDILRDAQQKLIGAAAGVVSPVVR
jgi:hypothetical protein